MSLGGRENLYLAGDVLGGAAAKPYSETFATLVDTEVQRIRQENYATAVQLLQTHRQALDALAEALVEHETLDEEEILKVTGLTRAPHLQEPSTNGRAELLGAGAIA
jgi:cell division protease FtsH